MNIPREATLLYWCLTSLRYFVISGTQGLSHVRNPVHLSVGECIEFKSYPAHRVLGNWTWRKDSSMVPESSRITISNGILSISDVTRGDSAYYSAEVQTTGGRELFRFWLTVTECDRNQKKNPYFQGTCRSWCEKKCTKGWKHYDGGCYKYFGEIKSWEDALDSCRSFDAKLVITDDSDKNEFVSSLLESGEGAWIGLNDRQTESVYLWNNDRAETASYYSWAKGEPSNTNAKCNVENCVEMKYPNLKWNDMVCNGYNSYVCQLRKDNVNVTSSWSCYGTVCFRYFPEQLIWKDSKMRCEELGGELARITNLPLAKFVGKLIHSNVWIGLNDIAEAGVYVWKNAAVGKIFDKTSFFNWDVGEPNDKLYETLRLGEECSGEDCVAINRWNNVVSWYDIECSKKLPYVCEKTRDSLLTIGAVIGISVGGSTVVILITAYIQFRVKNWKNKKQIKRLVFNTQKVNPST